MNYSPVDIIFYNKKFEIESKIPKPNSTLLTELNKYVLKTRELTLDKILESYSEPEKSYNIFNTPNLQGGSVGWSCKYNDDPRFDMIIKYVSDGVWQFDFNFLGRSFNKENKVSGTNYMNTLHKVVKDEVISFMDNKKIGDSLYFTINNEDGLGEARKKIFNYLLNKYIDKNKFEIDKENDNFNITKIK